jgi:hypothetical protein
MRMAINVVGVVHIFVSRQPTVDGLSQQATLFRRLHW